MKNSQERELVRVLKLNTLLQKVLKAARQLKFPNWYVGAGSIPQIYWNYIHDFDLNHGIKDFDVVYFDDKDLSKDTEKANEIRLKSLAEKIPIQIEIVNQARVHLWYKEEFHKKIKPYTSTKNAILTWPTTASAIGIRLNKNNEFEVYAPFGLKDLFELKVRANKKLISQEIFEKKAKSWKQTWPKLKVVPW